MPAFPSLTPLALLLGIGYLIPQIAGLVRPQEYSRWLRAFPRSRPWGYPLVILATLWFLLSVVQSQREISDFADYTTAMLLGFAALGIGTCLLLDDFLAARGLAVLMLLLAKCMVDNARWNESSWRLLIVFWAYAWVLMGAWYTVSPWRMRDWFQWLAARPARLRALCALRALFALLVILLALLAY